jgi:hypothetical protein
VVGTIIGVIEHVVSEFAVARGMTLSDDLVFGFVPGLVFGLGSGVLFGLIRWAQVPIGAEEATSPRSTLKTDRTLYLGLTSLLIFTFIVVFALASGLSASAGFLAGFSNGLLRGLEGGVVLGLVLGLAGAWPLYVLARSWLALRGRLPWRFSAFLEDAHELGILRRVGAVYQFRHADLQDRLVAGRSTDSGHPQAVAREREGSQFAVPES